MFIVGVTAALLSHFHTRAQTKLGFQLAGLHEVHDL